MENKTIKRLLLHAWSVEKCNAEYFIASTHWLYLKEITEYYDEIVLLSPVKHIKESQQIEGKSIKCFENVKIYSLPYNKGYINSLKFFMKYLKAYRDLKGISTYYARYPVPFGWLQKFYGKNSRRIIHYVGDPVDAALHNPNFSSLKKYILIVGFILENSLYKWACKGGEVFTNGYHIADKLLSSNINASPLISSTLSESDFCIRDTNIDKENIRFVYLGNLRTAKGVETVIRAFKLFNDYYRNSSLTIIGSGEHASELEMIVELEKINNVHFVGRINDREQINKLLRENDGFLFASLSEGSPRVILEAIANGLVVISTPVGSLPAIFENNKDLLFAKFNDSQDFYEKMRLIVEDVNLYNQLKNNSFEKVKKLTLKNFIKIIFDEK